LGIPVNFLTADALATPRSARVTAGSAAEHQNGATGIVCLELSAPDVRAAARSLAALIGAPEASEVYLRLGGCTLSPVSPGQDEEARERLDAADSGPLAVVLAAGAPGEVKEIDRRLSEGVGIRLLGRTPLAGNPEGYSRAQRGAITL
jgi:hypothetical protein